jgi:hypothetical protein
MATIMEPPRQCPLHGPPPGPHWAALPRCLGRGLHVDGGRLLQASPPRLQPLGRIGPLHPDVAPPLDTLSNRRGSSRHPSQAISRASIGHDHGPDHPPVSTTRGRVRPVLCWWPSHPLASLGVAALSRGASRLPAEGSGCRPRPRRSHGRRVSSTRAQTPSRRPRFTAP